MSPEHARRTATDERPDVPQASLVVGVAVLVMMGAVAFALISLPAPANHAGGSHATGSSTTSSPAHPVTTTTAPLGPVTISAVGDTDLGNTPDLPPDPTAYLEPVKAALQGPIVFANLEGTLTERHHLQVRADIYRVLRLPEPALGRAGAESDRVHRHQQRQQSLARLRGPGSG